MPRESDLPDGHDLAGELDSLMKDQSLETALRQPTIIDELQRDFLMGEFYELQVADYTGQDTQKLANRLKSDFPVWKQSMLQSLRSSGEKEWSDAADQFGSTVTLDTLRAVTEKDVEYFRKRSVDLLPGSEEARLVERSMAYWSRVREIIGTALQAFP